MIVAGRIIIAVASVVIGLNRARSGHVVVGTGRKHDGERQQAHRIQEQRKHDKARSG